MRVPTHASTLSARLNARSSIGTNDGLQVRHTQDFVLVWSSIGTNHGLQVAQPYFSTHRSRSVTPMICGFMGDLMWVSGARADACKHPLGATQRPPVHRHQRWPAGASWLYRCFYVDSWCGFIRAVRQVVPIKVCRLACSHHDSAPVITVEHPLGATERLLVHWHQRWPAGASLLLHYFRASRWSFLLRYSRTLS